MNKQQRHYNNRYPYGRDSWKFAKSQRLSYYYSPELPSIPNSYVEIPAEIVEKIYKQGWEDAIIAAKEAINENT